jgi:hypothetical protein
MKYRSISLRDIYELASELKEQGLETKDALKLATKIVIADEKISVFKQANCVYTETTPNALEKQAMELENIANAIKSLSKDWDYD